MIVEPGEPAEEPTWPLTPVDKEALLARLRGGSDDARLSPALEAANLASDDDDVHFEVAASWVVSEQLLAALHEQTDDASVRERMRWNRFAPLDILGTATYEQAGGLEYRSYCERRGRSDLIRRMLDFDGDRSPALSAVFEELAER